MYGECGGAGFYAKTLYRYWAANYASGGSFLPQNKMQVVVDVKFKFMESFKILGTF